METIELRNKLSIQKFCSAFNALTITFRRQSAKESLAVFMRENVYVAATAAPAPAPPGPPSIPLSPPGPPILLAQLRHDEFSSVMKKRLAEFVRKFMKAEIHEGEHWHASYALTKISPYGLIFLGRRTWARAVIESVTYSVPRLPYFLYAQIASRDHLFYSVLPYSFYDELSDSFGTSRNIYIYFFLLFRWWF